MTGVFSLWDSKRTAVDCFIEQANTFHPTIKFRAEISENKVAFLDTVVFKGERFILDIKTHYKTAESIQYTHFTSCHPPGVKRGFIKGQAIRLLRTNSSKTTFEECLANFQPKNHDGKLEFHRKSAPAENNFQKSSDHILQKR